jgi:hypothetical protein
MRMKNYYDEYPRLLNNYPDDDDQNLIKAKRKNKTNEFVIQKCLLNLDVFDSKQVQHMIGLVLNQSLYQRDFH